MHTKQLRDSRRKLKALRHSLASTTTYGISAAFAWKIFPPSIIGIGVLGAHEMSHYLTAHQMKANPNSPLFIPLGPFVVGLTEIDVTHDLKRSSIAISGPITGALFSACGLVLFSFIGYSTGIVIATGALVMEIIQLIFGKDGKAVHDKDMPISPYNSTGVHV